MHPDDVWVGVAGERAGMIYNGDRDLEVPFPFPSSQPQWPTKQDLQFCQDTYDAHDLIHRGQYLNDVYSGRGYPNGDVVREVAWIYMYYNSG